MNDLSESFESVLSPRHTVDIKIVLEFVKAKQGSGPYSNANANGGTLGLVCFPSAINVLEPKVPLPQSNDLAVADSDNDDAGVRRWGRSAAAQRELLLRKHILITPVGCRRVPPCCSPLLYLAQGVDTAGAQVSGMGGTKKAESKVKSRRGLLLLQMLTWAQGSLPLKNGGFDGEHAKSGPEVRPQASAIGDKHLETCRYHPPEPKI